MSSNAPLRCRAIAEADLRAVADLLTEGFPDRSLYYWRHALEQLRGRDAPAGYPRYGMMLESGGACVGVLLQIHAELAEGGRNYIRCNGSSWYVAPAFRGYAPLLVKRAIRYPEVTYINVSPAEHTWPILQAQGYRRYSEGQMAAVPMLSPGRAGVRVRRYRAGEAGFDPILSGLLDAHARMGLIVLVCDHRGARAAFAFLPRNLKGVGRAAVQLAYCADTESFVGLAGPLGRWLTLRGYPIVILDAQAPLRGLVGRFFKDRCPKYFRGAEAPRLNDLAYTEAVLFGA